MARADLQTSAWRRLRAAVLARDGWECRYCGKAIEGRDATVDHIVPVAVGGEGLPPMSGLVAACRSCNSTRQAKVLHRMPWVNRKWLTHI